MDKLAILQALRELVGQKQIQLMPLLEKDTRFSAYDPIHKYLFDLKNHSKPESAAEDLFRSLMNELLGLSVQPQVRTVDGFVDFAVLGGSGDPVVVELKPLFELSNDECLGSMTLKPASHLDQIQKYLRKHEYVILTDLRDAYLYNARDTFVDGKPFRHLEFPELLERTLQTQSLLDVLRRAEDEVEKPELDRTFFEDLGEWFRRFREVKFTTNVNPDELVILLINKIIFAKTLEDYGLVPFRFVQNEYENQKERWVAKGSKSTIRSFLANFEEFFDEHYDTELFETKLWSHLDQSHENLDRFAHALDDVLGIDTWNKTFARGIVHYNYRRINEDIFGKSYEMFLAANRKDEGIYYTPAPITTPMANSLVAALIAPLVDELVAILSAKKPDYAAANKLMERLCQIRIVDMAGGSGGFQIKVLRALWEQYLRIAAACAPAKPPPGKELFDVSPDELRTAEFRQLHLLREAQRRQLVAAILLRHLWYVDKDPGALEVAKTNVWKEAVKLSPADYNFRELRDDAAKILPNLELNFICNDSLVDADIDKQIAWLSTTGREAVVQLHALRSQYMAKPSDHAPLEKALEVRREIRKILIGEFAGENLPCEPLLAALSFFPCYFTADGKARPAAERGFDGNIGNPPWGNAKPVRKEFARVGKYSIDAGDTDAWFDKKLETDAEFRARWEQYQAQFEAYKVYLWRKFQYQGTGDWNYFKLFLENNLTLLKQAGRLSILVPSGIQTDEGCAALRKLLTTEHTLLELTSFENRGYTAKVNGHEKTVKIFPDVDNRYKFGYLYIVKGVPTPKSHSIDARFYLHDPADATSPAIRYSVEMLRRFSPTNLSLMEFRTERDYELCAKIRSEHPLLGDLGHQFRRELHMTEDSHFFKKRLANKLKAGDLLLYEGKMIFQFDDGFAPGTYYVIEKEVREQLLRKELFRLAHFVRESKPKLLEGKPLPKGRELEERLEAIFTKKRFKLDYEFERLGYRAVGSSTNERSQIATIVRPNVVMAHSIYFLVPFSYTLDKSGRLSQEAIPSETTSTLAAVMNSLVWNYYLRSKVSANLNISIVEEGPIPKLPDKLRSRLAAAAEKLLAAPRNTKERAKLEVLVAREVYGLDLDDWRHLTGTFTYGGGDSKAELDEIIARSIDLWK